jgi:hypothetical protein
MPTRIYSKQDSGAISFNGKTYSIQNGSVEVPDEAVDILCEAHGFSKDEISEVVAPQSLDLNSLTRNQLIEINFNEKLGAEINMNLSKEKVLAIVKPLYDAKHNA